MDRADASPASDPASAKHTCTASPGRKHRTRTEKDALEEEEDEESTPEDIVKPIAHTRGMRLVQYQDVQSATAFAGTRGAIDHAPTQHTQPVRRYSK